MPGGCVFQARVVAAVLADERPCRFAVTADPLGEDGIAHGGSGGELPRQPLQALVEGTLAVADAGAWLAGHGGHSVGWSGHGRA